MPLAELLPAITIDGRTSPLLDPRRCYIANDERRNGYAVLTSITTFSLANPHDLDSVCYDEPADGVYASHDALYLSEPRYGKGCSQQHAYPQVFAEGARRGICGLGGTAGHNVGRRADQTFACRSPMTCCAS